MTKNIFLFDGQGAFRPGIGKELYLAHEEAKTVIDSSSKVLKYDLTEWLWGDRASETTGRTSIAQPAISTIALAYGTILRSLGITAEISLGHSLGEVTAIVYCEIVSLEDGLRIIQKRGEVMEREGKHGTMMAVMNIEASKLQKMCEQVSADISEAVVVANINTPSQIVISGSQTGIKKVAQLVARERGRAIPLKVGGAWHSPYLKDAAREFSGFLDTITFQTPRSKFYSVVKQRVLDDPEEIKESLKQQMLAQVDWVKAITNIISLKYTSFLEIGPSKILKDLVTKIDPAVQVDSTALYTEMEKLKQRR